MCKARADGGQRCAAHARTKWHSATAQLGGALTSGDPEAVSRSQRAWDQAAIEYASTPKGKAELEDLTQVAEDQADLETAAMLRTVLVRGQAMREANDEVHRLLNARRDGRDAADQAHSARHTGVGRLTNRGQESWAVALESAEDLTERITTCGDGSDPEEALHRFRSLETIAVDPQASEDELLGALRTHERGLRQLVRRRPTFHSDSDAEAGPGWASRGAAFAAQDADEAAWKALGPVMESASRRMIHVATQHPAAGRRVHTWVERYRPDSAPALRLVG